MKTEWICKWQLIPGNKEHIEVYPTRDAARKAMAKILTDAVNLKTYIQDLRNAEGEDCGTSADFLEKFLTDLTIPESEGEIPPHLEIPDHCLLEIHSSEGFRWGYMRKECPLLVVSNVYYGDGNEPFIVDFGYENPESIRPDRVNAVHIRIDEHINYGTSAYPLMVLFALREYPQTQERIIRTISETWDTDIDRKTVGRHLQLLQDMGFAVQHGPDGYYYDEESHDPKPGISYSPSAYPLMICEVLDEIPKTQAAIMQAVQEKYGTTINRKAVRRHLELLKALGFDLLKKYKDGYYIGS